VTDVFAIQSEIAERIADALRIRLTAGDRARLGRGQTDNLAAYELFLKADELLRRRASGMAERRAQVLGAVAMLRQATELDPGYAAPLAFLAWAYDEHPDLSLQERRDSARVFAERVIRMAPELPHGYAELGWYHVTRGDLEAGGKQFRLALDRDPNSEMALAGMVETERLSGRPSQALVHGKRRLEIAPAEPVSYHGQGLVLAALGDFEAAETWIRKAWFEVGDDPSTGHCELADLGRHRGDRAATRRHLDALLAVEPVGEFSLECAAFLELTLGNPEAARRLADRGARIPYTRDGVPRLLLAGLALHEGDSARAATLLREAEVELQELWEMCDGRCQNYNLGRIRALQGRPDEAIAYVQRTVDTGWGMWYPAAPDPLMAPIQDDPRYQAILADIRARMDAERARAASFMASG
jgi:tetratricopeptide (TPR) repeat protein